MKDKNKEETKRNQDTIQKATESYRKLSYFFENKIPVHIKTMENGNEIWLNGSILDISGEKLTMVLQELQRGCLPILLENVTKISKYKERGEKDE